MSTGTELSPRLEAFQTSPRYNGIDLLRSQVHNQMGIFVADINTQFRAGMLVQLNSDQRIEICDGTIPFGFAKFNKSNLAYCAVIGEYLQLNGVMATNLLHANLLNPASGGGVRVGIDLTGTPYTETTDYVINYVNGQINRTAGSAIPNNSYVYVNYQYQLSSIDMLYEGYNYWNMINDVSLMNYKITVINDWSLIFTTMYDTSQTYSVNDVVYAGKASLGLQGLVTKTGRGTAYIGRVFQPPTASDPYLGLRYVGGMVS